MKNTSNEMKKYKTHNIWAFKNDMLSKAINLLKRNKRPREEEQSKVKENATRDGGNIFSRAFKKIRRQIFRSCQLTNAVPAICVERSPCPAASQSSKQYMVTPAPNKSVVDELPREYNYMEFVNMRESRRFEFKTGGGQYPIQILPEHIRKYGSAFLNCDGGILIAGILDNGLVHGIFCDWKMEIRISDTVHREISKFYPPVDQSLYSVRFMPVFDRRTRCFIRDTKVVEISFKNGDPLSLYESGDHKVYLRREGSVEGPLSPLQIRDVVKSKYKKVLEERRGLDITLLSP